MKDREDRAGVGETGQVYELPADELERRAQAFFGSGNDGGETSEVVKPVPPSVPRVIEISGKPYYVRDANTGLAASDEITTPQQRRRLFAQRKRPDR